MIPAPIFVGREREMDRLERRLQATCAGAGAVVTIVGEAGIGKTAVVEAFARIASARGAAVIRGSCLEAQWSMPYGPWVEALRELIGSLGPARLTLPDDGPSPLGQWLPELRAAGVQVPALGDPREERFRLYDAITQALLRAAERAPLVIVLEDLHWAEPDSLALLRHTARFARRARLLFVGTFRDAEVGADHPLGDVLVALRRDVDHERIALRGLSFDEGAALLAEAAGRRLPDAAARALLDETGGNPFYLREVLRHLLEEAKITLADGAATAVADLRTMGVPEGVREVLGRRLARLSAATQRALEIAAALSFAFELPALAALTGLADEALLDALDEAWRAGILRVSAAGKYEFSHAIARRAILDGSSPDRRARLHRRIAETLARIGGRAAEIAQQYHASSSLPGAAAGVPHALRAAESAREAAAHDQAVAFLRLARDLAGREGEADPALRADILRRLSQAEAGALLSEDAPRTAREAAAAMAEVGAAPLAIAAHLGDVARELKLGGAPRAIWHALAASGLALAGADRGLVWARLRLLEERCEPISASAPIAMVRWLGRDPEAVAAVRALGDEADLAATLEYDLTTPDEVADALRRADGWTQPTAIIRAMCVAARAMIHRHGAYGAAIDRLSNVVAIAERCGSIPGQAEAWVQLGHCYAAIGEPARSREATARAREMVARLGPGHRLHGVTVAMSATEAYLLGGHDWAELADEASRLAADPAGGQHPVGHVAAGIAAMTHALAGHRREALALIEALASLFERCDDRVYLYGGTLELAIVAAWHLEAAELAPRLRARALDRAPYAGLIPCSCPSLGLARLAILEGDHAEAETQLDRARVILAERGQRAVRVVVDHDHALALAQQGGAAKARVRPLLERALAEARALQMAPWIVRCQAAIESLKPAYPDGLSSREVEVLRLLSAGRSNKEIATRLFLSVATVQRHVANIYLKIGVHGRAGATAYAIRHRLTEGAA